MDDEMKKKAVSLFTGTGLANGISRELIAELIAACGCTVEEYKKDEILIADTEEMEYLYIVQKGRLLARFEDDLFSSITYRSGEIVAFDVAMSETRENYMTTVAEKATTVLAIPLDAMFDELDRKDEFFSRKITVNILRNLSNECIRRMKRIRILSAKSRRKKIRIYLEQQEKKYGSQSFVTSDDRAKMARHLGLTREALSRELGIMEREGLIKCEGKHFELLYH